MLIFSLLLAVVALYLYVQQIIIGISENQNKIQLNEFNRRHLFSNTDYFYIPQAWHYKNTRNKNILDHGSREAIF